jgi:hypothetical protein
MTKKMCHCVKEPRFRFLKAVELHAWNPDSLNAVWARS